MGLILNVYAPNLWRLFTTYGQFRGSIRATLPRIAYPSGAKCSERAQFGVPDSAPFSKQVSECVRVYQKCVINDPMVDMHRSIHLRYTRMHTRTYNKTQDCIAADPDFAAKVAEMNSFAGDNPGTTDRILNSAFTMPITKLNNEGIVLSEAQILRVFQDFGVVPNLLSKV